jgi:hypothetical protein
MAKGRGRGGGVTDTCAPPPSLLLPFCSGQWEGNGVLDQGRKSRLSFAVKVPQLEGHKEPQGHQDKMLSCLRSFPPDSRSSCPHYSKGHI